MIGIIGAMDEEVEQLVEVMEITREQWKKKWQNLKKICRSMRL